MFNQIKYYAKFVVAIVGAGLTAFSQFIPTDYAAYVTAGLAFLTAITVLVVPNDISDEQIRDHYQPRQPLGE